MNSTIKPKPCKICSSPWHTPMFHKPRKPIVTRTVPKRSPIKPKVVRTQKDRVRMFRRINQNGKVAQKWGQFRDEWFATHKNPYTCHYCGILLSHKTITLDHRIPRSRAPELRYEDSNIVPCCFTCNGLKGSVAHDDYEHTCYT